MLDLGDWSRVVPLLLPSARPRIVGVSGGRTSAMMAALLRQPATLSFQNTGREAAATYAFVEQVAEAIERPITWLEYRPPPTKGGRPCESRVAVVTPATADRSGGPFEMLMEALNAFRASRGKGPIAPWWRSRICTTYMKTRTARNYVLSLGWTSWDEVVGLRADEPARVARLQVGVPRRIGRLAPLSEVGITKKDVNDFWAAQSFDLEIDDYMGCFLKDQADLSRALAQPETDAVWWAKMERTWPGFGGKNFAGYAQLALEARERFEIEDKLRESVTPTQSSLSYMSTDRFRLVVIQERKRLAGQGTPFSCQCEGSNTAAELDDEAEDAFVLGLPE